MSKGKKNKENRKAGQRLVHTIKLPEEMDPPVIKMCTTPLKDENTNGYFQVNTSKTDSLKSSSSCQPGIQLHNSNSNAKNMEILNTENEECSPKRNLIETENYYVEEVVLVESESQSNGQMKNEFVCFESNRSFETNSNELESKTENLQLFHKAEATLDQAVSQQDEFSTVAAEHAFLETSLDANDLHIYHPEIQLNECHSQTNDEDLTDRLAEKTTDKTAVEIIEQIIDELYDNCINPQVKSINAKVQAVKNDEEDNELNSDKEQLASGSSEPEILINQHKGNHSYFANETSRLLNSSQSTDDELETDHVVPDYVYVEREIEMEKDETESLSKIKRVSSQTNTAQSSEYRPIVEETPIAPTKKKSIRKEKHKDENYCSFCCFL